jgi:dipeptidyl aminopeptidase/acylaminoacyl peptidase
VLCFNVPDPDFERLARMDFTAYENWNRGVGDPGKRRIQEGLVTAIARLDAMGVIDPTRVGVTGLSYGGEAVMYALFHMPRLAAAIASGTEFGPASTFLYGLAGHDLLQRWGLDRWDSPRWDTLSITRNAERVYAPLLLNVADREMIDAMHPYTALEQAGRAVEMYVFPGEHHIKSEPAHRLAIYQRNIDWMNFWLRGVEDPDPAKAPQYQRWRSLRGKQCKLFTGPNASSYCVH